MLIFAQQLAACAAALAFTFGCARVETAPTAGEGGPPPADFSASADAVLVSTDDQNDAALAVTRRLDADGREGGELPRLSPQEHMRRAGVYHANRAFNEARAHWRALIDRHPTDANVPQALFLTGRSLFQEKRYEEALRVFEDLAGSRHLDTPAGRDGFYYVAATLLRLDRPGEAATRYAEYAERFPEGERIENAYLNAVDSLREAGRHDEAIQWIEKTRARFAGKPAEVSAAFARLRLELARGRWVEALRAADELPRARLTKDVNATPSEIAYLRAFALEQAGRREEAARAYQALGDGIGSYFGWRATERLRGLGGASKALAAQREERVRAEVRRRAVDYPAPFRESLLAAARRHSVDPRFLLAVMRQESSFNTNAKSPAAARGLLQLTPEVAAKYARAEGMGTVSEADLYRPEVNIRLGAAYVADLFKMFPNLPEAVSASYNGGEENVARWVRRAVHKDPGVVASEVGFTESKDYVNKVLANYRAYQLIYDEQLGARR
ncbi:MAG TPA: transglycosylase SLT domain-containing protein [Pyrinomonadaceae bacterium]|nr:transglycosylase SLT domain-containing protein [Pyrinomonadaceae bacterium]